MKKRNGLIKVLALILCMIFLVGTANVSTEASTKLSKAVIRAYKGTVGLRLSWGNMKEISSKNIKCKKVFSDYYEALAAYKVDPKNAYYNIVYTQPKKSTKKFTKSLGTPIDFLEYTVVGFPNKNGEKRFKVHKCKGTLWLKKVSGEYVIKKAKRTITHLDDYKEEIHDKKIIKKITYQINSFVGSGYNNDDYSYDYNNDNDDFDYDNEDETDNNNDDFDYDYDNEDETDNNNDDFDYDYDNEDETDNDNDDFDYDNEDESDNDNDVDYDNGNDDSYDYYDNDEDNDASKNVELAITSCPKTSTVNTAVISGYVSYDGQSYAKVSINGNSVDVYQSTGFWTQKVQLNEGLNIFYIVATDSKGRTATVTKEILYKIPFGVNFPVLIVNNCPDYSSTKTVTISGKVTDSNDYNPKVYINDELINVNSSSGFWSKEVTLKEGVNTFTFMATNNLGKVAYITKLITFYFGAPEIWFSNFPESSNVKTVTICGTVKDKNDDNPKLYINNEQISVDKYSNGWSKVVTLRDGANTFFFQATNNQGKSYSVIKNINFNVSTPNIVIDNCPESSTVDRITISGKITDTNDDNPKLTINDEIVSVNSNSYTWSKDFILKEGINTFIIKVTNSVGKSTTITKTVNFVTGAPNIILTVFPDSALTDTVTVSGKVTDANDKAPKIYINGELISVNTMDNSWSKTLTIVDGPNIFEIKAINSYGKTTVLTKNILFVYAPPILQVSVCPETSAVEKVVISGTVSDLRDTNPIVQINNEAVTVTSGSWSKEVILKAGMNSFAIKAINKAGKETIITKTITFTPAVGK